MRPILLFAIAGTMIALAACAPDDGRLTNAAANCGSRSDDINGYCAGGTSATGAGILANEAAAGAQH